MTGRSGAVLGQRQLAQRHPAVDVGAAHRQHPLDAGADARLQHVQRALGVDPEGVARDAPRAADVAQPGQVVDGVGPHAADEVGPAVAVEQVGPAPSGRRPRPRRRGRSRWVDQVAADEAGGARDERLHGAVAVEGGQRIRCSLSGADRRRRPGTATGAGRCSAGPATAPSAAPPAASAMPAARVPVNRPHVAPAPRRQLAAGAVVVVQGAGERVGQRVVVAGLDEQGGVAEHLGQGTGAAWPPPGRRRPWPRAAAGRSPRRPTGRRTPRPRPAGRPAGRRPPTRGGTIAVAVAGAADRGVEGRRRPSRRGRRRPGARSGSARGRRRRRPAPAAAGPCGARPCPGPARSGRRRPGARPSAASPTGQLGARRGRWPPPARRARRRRRAPRRPRPATGVWTQRPGARPAR